MTEPAKSGFKLPVVGALTLALLAAGVLAILLVVPIPIKGRTVSSLMDLVHAPAFALLAVLACKAAAGKLPGSLWGKLLVVALPLAMCGLVAELVQSLVGRGTSWNDARANLLGACAGVCWYQSRPHTESSYRRLLLLGSCGFIALASLIPLCHLFDGWLQQRQFPLFASFETPFETSRFGRQSAKLKRIERADAGGHWAMRIELQPDLYPGILLDGAGTDWTGYQALSFDLIVSEGPPLNLIVKVHDREHRDHDFAGDDRFDGQFQLTPGLHHIRVPLDDIQNAPRTRKMNMANIEGVQIFTYDLTEPRTIVLDNLRLE